MLVSKIIWWFLVCWFESQAQLAITLPTPTAVPDVTTPPDGIKNAHRINASLNGRLELTTLEVISTTAPNGTVVQEPKKTIETISNSKLFEDEDDRSDDEGNAYEAYTIRPPQWTSLSLTDSFLGDEEAVTKTSLDESDLDDVIDESMAYSAEPISTENVNVLKENSEYYSGYSSHHSEYIGSRSRGAQDDEETQTQLATTLPTSTTVTDGTTQPTVRKSVHRPNTILSDHLEPTTLEVTSKTVPNEPVVPETKNLGETTVIKPLEDDRSFGENNVNETYTNRLSEQASLMDSSLGDEVAGTKTSIDDSNFYDVIDEWMAFSDEPMSTENVNISKENSENYSGYGSYDNEYYWSISRGEQDDEESIFTDYGTVTDSSLFESDDPTEEDLFGETSMTENPSLETSVKELESDFDLPRYTTEISVIENIDGQRIERKLTNRKNIEHFNEPLPSIEEENQPPVEYRREVTVIKTVREEGGKVVENNTNSTMQQLPFEQGLDFREKELEVKGDDNSQISMAPGEKETVPFILENEQKSSTDIKSHPENYTTEIKMNETNYDEGTVTENMQSITTGSTVDYLYNTEIIPFVSEDEEHSYTDISPENYTTEINTSETNYDEITDTENIQSRTNDSTVYYLYEELTNIDPTILAETPISFGEVDTEETAKFENITSPIEDDTEGTTIYNINLSKEESEVAVKEPFNSSEQVLDESEYTYSYDINYYGSPVSEEDPHSNDTVSEFTTYSYYDSLISGENVNTDQPFITLNAAYEETDVSTETFEPFESILNILFGENEETTKPETVTATADAINEESTIYNVNMSEGGLKVEVEVPVRSSEQILEGPDVTTETLLLNETVPIITSGEVDIEETTKLETVTSSTEVINEETTIYDISLNVDDSEVEITELISSSEKNLDITDVSTETFDPFGSILSILFGDVDNEETIKPETVTSTTEAINEATTIFNISINEDEIQVGVEELASPSEQILDVSDISTEILLPNKTFSNTSFEEADIEETTKLETVTSSTEVINEETTIYDISLNVDDSEVETTEPISSSEKNLAITDVSTETFDPFGSILSILFGDVDNEETIKPETVTSTTEAINEATTIFNISINEDEIQVGVEELVSPSEQVLDVSDISTEILLPNKTFSNTSFEEADIEETTKLETVTSSTEVINEETTIYDISLNVDDSEVETTEPISSSEKNLAITDVSTETFDPFGSILSILFGDVDNEETIKPETVTSTTEAINEATTIFNISINEDEIQVGVEELASPSEQILDVSDISTEILLPNKTFSNTSFEEADIEETTKLETVTSSTEVINEETTIYDISLNVDDSEVETTEPISSSEKNLAITDVSTETFDPFGSILSILFGDVDNEETIKPETVTSTTEAINEATTIFNISINEDEIQVGVEELASPSEQILDVSDISTEILLPNKTFSNTSFKEADFEETTKLETVTSTEVVDEGTTIYNTNLSTDESEVGVKESFNSSEKLLDESKDTYSYNITYYNSQISEENINTDQPLTTPDSTYEVDGEENGTQVSLLDMYLKMFNNGSYPEDESEVIGNKDMHVDQSDNQNREVPQASTTETTFKTMSTEIEEKYTFSSTETGRIKESLTLTETGKLIAGAPNESEVQGNEIHDDPNEDEYATARPMEIVFDFFSTLTDGSLFGALFGGDQETPILYEENIGGTEMKVEEGTPSESDKPAAMENDREDIPYIVGRVFEQDANFSVKVIAKEASFYAPSSAYLLQDLDTLNITWASSNDALNNSLSFRLSETAENYVTNVVQLAVVQDGKLLVWEKNIAIKKSDGLGQRGYEIEFDDDVQVFVSNVDFLRTSREIEFNEIDADGQSTTSSEVRDLRTFHMEIGLGALAVVVVLGATMYLIITKAKERAMKNKNKEVNQHVAA